MISAGKLWENCVNGQGDTGLDHRSPRRQPCSHEQNYSAFTVLVNRLPRFLGNGLYQVYNHAMTIQDLQRESLAILDRALKSLRRETPAAPPSRPSSAPAALLLEAA